MSFLAELFELRVNRIKVNELAASRWRDLEPKLLDAVLELLKSRCLEAAACARQKAVIRFKSERIRVGPDRWDLGSFTFCNSSSVFKWFGVSPDCFHYATQGSQAEPKSIEEAVFQSYIWDKIKEPVKALGFQDADLKWNAAEGCLTITLPKAPPRELPRTKGNVFMECGVCATQKPMEAIQPCGHLLCEACFEKIYKTTARCPFCQIHMDGGTPLFKP